MGLTAIRQERLLRPQKVTEMEFFARDVDQELTSVLAWKMDWFWSDDPLHTCVFLHEEPDLELEQGLLHTRALRACAMNLPMGVSSSGLMLSMDAFEEFEPEKLMKVFAAALGPAVGLMNGFLHPVSEIGAESLGLFLKSHEEKTGEPSLPLVVGKSSENGGTDLYDHARTLGMTGLIHDVLMEEYLDLEGLTFAFVGEANQDLSRALMDLGLRENSQEASCVFLSEENLDCERLLAMQARFVVEMQEFSFSLEDHQKALEAGITVLPAYLFAGAHEILALNEHKMGLEGALWSEDHLSRRIYQSLKGYLERGQKIAERYRITLGEALVIAGLESLEKLLEEPL